MMEFHISRQARQHYQFDQMLYSTTGNIIFANFHAVRVFAQKMNAKRDLVRFPEDAVRAGQLNALGLIDEILHMVVEQYRQQRQPQVMQQALLWLDERFGAPAIDAVLRQFGDEFPPLAVFRNEVKLEDYLAGQSDGTPNRQLVLEEMLLLWLANANPAFAPYLELFDDSQLEIHAQYHHIVDSLHQFFNTQPTFGPEEQNLVDMLRSPTIASPHSLQGQLEYIRSRWGNLLGRYLYRILSGFDLISEEEKVVFGAGGQGPAQVYEFGALEGEPERFSPDREWMPNLVLVAKNTYVWLEQLSKKYQRSITRLDQIPDEELATLASWGISGLWLIGLWERSQASKRIKQMRGNPEAEASAYSLYSYEIARDLGGDEAYHALRQRAWQRGVRLAADMVPNHMGIDSRWVIEHPEWFVSLPHSPFPSYTFNGANLSSDPRVGLYIEDHYYDNSDAAVVFKRADFWTGAERYIYHGNDGTSMPWNDTAQLNYLDPAVREAVIQTILDVARKFPVIRFDAAMTLAKKHYQRLWYPEPGTGGAIPSRADYGLTKDHFDAAMPAEFWREVVDRVATEAPDTLLLAEAFWLMEGYFVRTLGMHRVYNSAFMNMLRDEKNQEYRLVIKNTLEFDPEILKRYVNFMNNPDERTAVDQFGKGDKYFGICTLLATLPGLPMLGHGQIEGFAEKYGMEYRRSYWEEEPDGYLVERHARQIFPLLRKRYLFAEAGNFLLYDFQTPEGQVNEDVFAYSNRAGEERALVVYHNKYAETRGRVQNSSAYLVKDESGERRLEHKSLAAGLGLRPEANMFTIFGDHTSGLEYLRNNADLHANGLSIELAAYSVHVFLDFREVQDSAWGEYRQLNDFLDGRGVPSVAEALQEIFLQNVHHPYRELVNAGQIRWFSEHRVLDDRPASDLQPVVDEIQAKLGDLVAGIRDFSGGSTEVHALPGELTRVLGQALHLPGLKRKYARSRAKKLNAALGFLLDRPASDRALAEGDPAVWATLFAWAVTHQLGMIASRDEIPATSRAWIDEWLLGKIMVQAMLDLGRGEETAQQAVVRIKTLTSHQAWYTDNLPAGQLARQCLHSWFSDPDFQHACGVNRYQQVLWVNKEAYEMMLWYLYTTSIVQLDRENLDKAALTKAIVARYDVISRLVVAATQAGYQVQRLLEQTF